MGHICVICVIYHPTCTLAFILALSRVSYSSRVLSSERGTSRCLPVVFIAFLIIGRYNCFVYFFVSPHSLPCSPIKSIFDLIYPPSSAHWWCWCRPTAGVDGYVKAKYGSTFTPCPGYDVQILDDAHRPVAPNTLGEWSVKCCFIYSHSTRTPTYCKVALSAV